MEVARDCEYCQTEVPMYSEPWGEDDNSSETTPESWYRSDSEPDQDASDVVIGEVKEGN